MLNSATQRLAAELREQGRSELFEHLQAHLWGEANSGPHAELATRLGMSEVNPSWTKKLLVAWSCRRAQTPSSLKF